MPVNILEVPSPPPSAKRSRSPEQESDVEEVRRTYQRKGAGTKTKTRMPFNPYTPEVEDAKSRASTDPFTPDEKVQTGFEL